MNYEIRNTRYTTLDRRHTFVFDFVYVEAIRSWRIYITQQPSYRGRPQGAHQSHRLNDGRGPFICWDCPIGTLDEAKGVARVWADATQIYIETGRFPPPGPPRQVPDWSSSANWEHRDRSGPPEPVRAQPPPQAVRPPAPSTPAPRPQGTTPRPRSRPSPTPARRQPRTFGGWLGNVWRNT